MTDIEVFHPSEGSSRRHLDEQALALASQMVNEAMDEDEVTKKAMALNAYTKYRNMVASDALAIIDRLASLPPKKLRILEMMLKKQADLDGFKKGSLSLAQVYRLAGKDK